MGLRVACADEMRIAHTVFWDRTHRDDHLSAKRPRGLQGDVGAEHRHIAPLFQVAHRDARADQGVLKGKRTAQGNGHQIIAPEIANVRHFVGHHPIAEHAIFGYVGANIDVGAKRR